MFKLNYYRRIQLSFLLFIIVPIITVSVISFVLIKETMVEKLQLTNENFLKVMIDEIGKTMDDATFASHFIVNDTSFKKYLKNFADTDRLRNYDDYTNFTEIKGVFSLITSKPLNNNTRMYLVNRKRFIIPSSEDDMTAVNDRLGDLYAKINFNQPETLQWLGMERDNSSKDGTYYIARVIYDSHEKQYLSVLIIGISQAYFEKLLKPVEFGKVVLFDAKGKRIAGSMELSAPDPSIHPSTLRSEVTLDKTDWTLVYEANKEAFTGKISRTFYAGIGGVILFFIIFSISSMYIAKRLHRPIQKLQRVVRQFGMGNLDVRLDVKGRDDIAELSHTLNTMLDQLKRLIHDIEQEQEQKRVMELEALFMQIRPHFLINTLNSIKCSLILQKDRLHSGIIDSLMSLLRAYMKFNEPTTLQEECELMRHYIDIMKIRNEIPVQLVVDVDPELTSWVIPKLMLQPIIENAIVHGLVDHPEAKIWIRARRKQCFITIEIEDNGEGIEEERRLLLNDQLQIRDSGPDTPYERVGLINVAQRLRLSFGSAAAIVLVTNERCGITAVLRIPVHDTQATLSGRNAI
ncbi:histidine kinase [Paenibacillus dokdonensis]|uniref:Histidine kinase n=1 Tax=Paenibacillus dokdonensis TaxID=2567944 RepID=A0ABU6GJE5_9BACL|nr:histidine kinase [Paenibacillus dokdonensis]MEC0238825.1 histidine kinase [Paenibacillus dokdonensis]